MEIVLNPPFSVGQRVRVQQHYFLEGREFNVWSCFLMRGQTESPWWYVGLEDELEGRGIVAYVAHALEAVE